WGELREKDQIGKGAFGTVFTAEFQSQKVVVKKLLGTDRTERMKFIKEAKLLNGFNSEYIVSFKGICTSPTAIMLEYMFFDFKPFIDDGFRVSCLQDFLTTVDEFDVVSSFEVQSQILLDVAKGLEYLHSLDCHHRDLKTANVLVSNQHYCQLEGKELAEDFSKKPIVCKLTDFGESRSKDIQTLDIVSTRTSNVERGTPAYMAPEILCNPKNSLSNSELKEVDIWAFGMIIYSVLNPDVDFPYKKDIQEEKNKVEGNFNALRCMKQILRRQQRPSPSAKYKDIHETKWRHLSEAYERCTSFVPSSRPTIGEVLEILDSDAKFLTVLPLRVHQGSAVERFDEQFVSENPNIHQSLLNRDGTNGCAFLSVIIADRVLNCHQDDTCWKDVCTLAEDVISNSPIRFNHLRDKGIYYDAQEAYTILFKENIVQSNYQLTEEIISSSYFSSKEGKNDLVKAVQNLRRLDDQKAVAVYCSANTVLMIGSLKGQLFVVDTHPRVQGENDAKTAHVAVFEKHPDDAQRLCSWIVSGLRERKVRKPEDKLQSFSIIIQEKRDVHDVSIDVSSGSKLADQVPSDEEDGSPKKKSPKKQKSSNTSRCEYTRLSSDEEDGSPKKKSPKKQKSSNTSRCEYTRLSSDEEDGSPKKKSPKKKKRSNTSRCEYTRLSSDEEEDCSQKKSPKKQKSSNTSRYEYTRLSSDEEDGSPKKKSPKKKKRSNTSRCEYTRLSSDEEEDCSQKKSPKKKKRSNTSRCEYTRLSSDEEEDCSQKKSPKKKKRSNTSRCEYTRLSSDEEDDCSQNAHAQAKKTYGSQDEGRATSTLNNTPDTANKLPVLRYINHGLSLKEIIKICVKGNVPKEKICTAVPTMVQKSAVYVVDLSSVQILDLAVDDCGAYGNHSSPSVVVEVDVDDDGNLGSAVRNVYKNEVQQSLRQAKVRQFTVKRQYSWHKLSKDYKRVIIKVEENNTILPLAIIQYIIKTRDPSKLFEKAHGGSTRNSSPYIRTKPSVLEKIRSLGHNQAKPKEIISEIERQAGDVRCMSSPSSIPRDRNQVYHQVRNIPGRVKSRSTGPSAAPNFPKLLSLQYSGSFVKNINLGVGVDKNGAKRAAPNTFAATDTCLQWLRRFCSGSSPKAVAGVDMTYKLGPFYLTTITFPNPMFVFKSNDQKNPTTLATIMTSTSKDKGDYEYLARCLKKEGVKNLTYGMDGECAMEAGFEDVYPIHNGCSGSNIHLRCFEHVKDDVNQKLLKLSMSESSRKSIISSILGNEHHGIRTKGLVDCDTNVEFQKMYAELEAKWPEEFRNWFETTCGRVRSLRETIRQCMLKPVRIAAGLGDPPNKWSNQRTESINNIIKEANHNQVCDQVQIHEVIESRVIKQQEHEYIKAIYNTGEYRLSPKYRRYAVSPLEWSRKTEAQRRASCKNSKSTAGLCQHSLAVAEKFGVLCEFLTNFNQKGNKEGKIIHHQVPKRAGEKPKEKKKRKGKNNIQSTPIFLEKPQADDDIDFEKPLLFSEVWHNKNAFNVIFTRDVKKVIKCASCKVEFAKGPVVCIPHDIAVTHKERYWYPKKNGQGQIIGMEPTVHKVASKFYCAKKSCILQRHPYFWKGMIAVDEDVAARLKQGHRNHLQRELHFTC
ncbi:High affinity nerve growth factor receptor, partial [Exaiptasia diaphana]